MARRRLAAVAVAGAILGLAGATSVGRGLTFRSGEACPGGGTLVAVHSADRRLQLCRDGRVEGEFRVALGRGGLDKRREGDGRTPLAAETSRGSRSGWGERGSGRS